MYVTLMFLLQRRLRKIFAGNIDGRVKLVQRVRVEDAAREIGCCPGYLRQQMRAGVWELGTVVKPSRKNGNYEYFIFREKLDRFLGRE